MSASDPITAAMREVVEAGQLAGTVTLVWRGGEMLHNAATGWRDVAAGLPMQRDSLFRIASMTKPITSTAAMMLLEEGKFALDDPITRWAPEFAGDAGPARTRRPPGRDRPGHAADHLRGSPHPSRRHHQQRLRHSGPIASAYREALGADIDSTVAPDDWIARLAALPLIDQPGADFHYGNCTDLLGLLLARMDDAPLGEVLERRIFGPLGMKDTGFSVPARKRDRRAGLYGFDAAGQLKRLEVAPGGSTLAERPDDLAFVSGAAGLWSTAPDYLAFARVFVGDGAVDGVRILKPETLKLMTANRLTDAQRAKAKILSMSQFAGHGFGLGVAVVLDPEKAAPVRGRGGVGTVGWPGAFGGSWQADPTNGTVKIILMHNMIELEQHHERLRPGRLWRDHDVPRLVRPPLNSRL